MTIVASAPANTPNGLVSVQVICNAPNSAGQFTIPASALLELPPGLAVTSGLETTTAGLSVSSIDPFPFSATGLDLSVIVTYVFNNLTVGYR